MKFNSNVSSVILKFLTAVAFSLSSSIASAQIFDSYSFEYGRASNAAMYRLGAQKWFLQDNAFLNEYHLRPYVEFSVAAVEERKYQNVLGQSKTIADFALTPVLRWQRDIREGVFVEIGVGLHYFTDHFNNGQKLTSTRYEFGDHFGMGYKFSNSLEVSLKFTHLSNAGFKKPNPAINFTAIRVAYSF